MQLEFWAAMTHVQFPIHQYPKVLSSRAVLYPFIPQLVLREGIAMTQVQALHLDLLDLTKFSWALCSSLSRFLWMASCPLVVLTSQHNLLRVNLIPLSVLLMKILNSTSPSTDPWGTPLITDLHLDLEPLTTTPWIWSHSLFLVYWTVHPWNPYLSNLERRMLSRTM